MRARALSRRGSARLRRVPWNDSPPALTRRAGSGGHGFLNPKEAISISTCYYAVLTAPQHPAVAQALQPLIGPGSLAPIPGDAHDPVAQWLPLDAPTGSACRSALRAAQIPYDFQVFSGPRGEEGPGRFIEYFRPEGSADGTIRRVPTTADGELFLALSEWDVVAARPGGPITREDVLAHLGVPARPLADWSCCEAPAS